MWIQCRGVMWPDLGFRKMTPADRGEDWGSFSQPPCKLCASLLTDLSVSPKAIQASVSKAASSDLSKFRSFLCGYLIHDTPPWLLSGGLSGLEGLALRAWAAKRWWKCLDLACTHTHICAVSSVWEHRCDPTTWENAVSRYVCTQVHICTQMLHTFISVCILVHIWIYTYHTHSYLHTHSCAQGSYTCLYTNHRHPYTYRSHHSHLHIHSWANRPYVLKFAHRLPTFTLHTDHTHSYLHTDCTQSYLQHITKLVMYVQIINVHIYTCSSHTFVSAHTDHRIHVSLYTDVHTAAVVCMHVSCSDIHIYLL